MEIFKEVFSVLWQVIAGIFKMIFTVVWDNLPHLMELKDILDHLTPLGMVAAVSGVSLSVLSAIVWIIKNGSDICYWIDRNLIDRLF